MKKQKLSLEELKVESFITKKGVEAKGGSTAACISAFSAAYLFDPITDAISVITRMSNDCPEYSEAFDCSMSA